MAMNSAVKKAERHSAFVTTELTEERQRATEYCNRWG